MYSTDHHEERSRKARPWNPLERVAFGALPDGCSKRDHVSRMYVIDCRHAKLSGMLEHIELPACVAVKLVVLGGATVLRIATLGARAEKHFFLEGGEEAVATREKESGGHIFRTDKNDAPLPRNMFIRAFENVISSS